MRGTAHCGALAELFAQRIEAAVGVTQPKAHHPEKCDTAREHLHVAPKQVRQRNGSAFARALACLLHDSGNGADRTRHSLAKAPCLETKGLLIQTTAAKHPGRARRVGTLTDWRVSHPSATRRLESNLQR